MALAHLIDVLTTFENDIPGWMHSVGVPGMSVALVDQDQVAWSRSFGIRTQSRAKRVDTDTVFEAASLSKPIFAYLALQLIQAGKIDLDAPLSQYMRKPYLTDEPDLPEITARRVLCHTCGLPNWTGSGHALKIYFPPGNRYSYSGEGYVYLQRVVEELTGKQLANYARQTLFQPLGMHRTSFRWEYRFENNHAIGHDENCKEKEKWKPESASAMSSLQTTAADYARFLTLMWGAKDGYTASLSSAMLDIAFTPQVMVNDLAPWNDDWPDGIHHPWPRVYWGLLWGLQTNLNRDLFFQWGDNFSFQAMVIGSRKDRTALVALSNGLNGARLWRTMFGMIFGQDLPGLDWLEKLYEET